MTMRKACLFPVVWVLSLFATAIFIGCLLLANHYDEWMHPESRP